MKLHMKLYLLCIAAINDTIATASTAVTTCCTDVAVDGNLWKTKSDIFDRGVHNLVMVTTIQHF